MLYMVTFTINIPLMLAYIPYMDPMGMCFFCSCNFFIYKYLVTIHVYVYIYKQENMLHISGISLLRSSIERNTRAYGYMYGYVFSLCIIIGWSWFGKHHSLLGIHQVAYNDAVPKFRGEGAGVAGCGGLNNDVETGLFVITRS